MAYTLDFAISLGSANTGLTLAAQLVNTSGTNTGNEVTTGFTEIGNGHYLWHYASIPAGHRGGAKFYEDGESDILAFSAINPEEAEDCADIGSDVWTNPTRNLTQSGASVASVVAGDAVTITRGDDMSATFTGLGAINAYANVWFTVKDSPKDDDDAALLQIDSDTGLLYIAGGAATTAGNATVTVNNATTGSVTFTAAASETAKLTPAANLYYDVQWQNSAGAITTLTQGNREATISGDVTRATS